MLEINNLLLILSGVLITYYLYCKYSARSISQIGGECGDCGLRGPVVEPGDAKGPGCRLYGNYSRDDSSLLGSNDLSTGCPIMAAETQYKFYNNPCMTAIPYGTKTAGWEYMQKLPELNRELYKDCTKYGCKKPDACPVLPGVAKLCGISPEETVVRNDITEEMYHNPQVFCEKNPDHPRCARYSGLFTPYTYNTGSLTPIADCKPIGPPPQTGVDGYCLEVNPNCSLDDTKSITILQPQMLDPRC